MIFQNSTRLKEHGAIKLFHEIHSKYGHVYIYILYIYIQGYNLAIAVSADVLAPNGARPLADTVATCLDLIILSFFSDIVYLEYI